MAVINNMKWLKRFLGLYDKKQAQRTEEVAEYVHARKNEFTKDMLNIQNQAKRVHIKTMQAQQESLKLKDIVDDVTERIALVTGGLK
jgi:hypothetical protein